MAGLRDTSLTILHDKQSVIYIVAVLQNRQDLDCATFIIDTIRKYYGTEEVRLIGQHTKMQNIRIQQI